MFGVTGTAIKWFQSYLEDRFQYVSIGTSKSEPKKLSFGVPQGSVLGPVLFTLYTYPISNIMKSKNVMYHFYADDTQIYDVDMKSNFDEKMERCKSCIEHVKVWMDENKLKLNEEKTEIMPIGSKRLLTKITKTDTNIIGSKINFVYNVKNLGVYLDSDLAMNTHVLNLRRNLLFGLRMIRSLRCYISKKNCEKLVYSLIFSKLDYCNSLLYGVTAENLKKLQVVQNSAAKMILKKCKYEEATPLLKDLHWLPVQKRIEFKIATLVFKCLHELAPPYLQELLKLKSPCRNLRSSSDVLCLEIPRTKLKAGERSFYFSGPHIWNALPLEIRKAESLETFKKKLKTYYFTLYFL